MSALTKEEKGVLELIHPGNYVEVLREPVVAAEITRRNPRHCITRPKAFDSPWTVVRPELVLTPGNVFFIVPNRTIYRLIKSRMPFGEYYQSSRVGGS
ncbi:hypothetical protein CDL15_Pgr020080 [Punica granatum]|uniref:Uncharacterized protein n=1 Tax=Punica granatum TaxID=22663 RepID=A0A218VR14_PUNGR|nr:hypothetical protein CDL15_Pgr020080 [Punica granatum]PKI76783.1 hypothetical protein CRG98_002769 [Punica granatum]